MTNEERMAQIAEACTIPEVQKFLSHALEQMVSEDEEMWQIVLEQVGGELVEGCPPWAGSAEAALASIEELLYLPDSGPRELFNLVNGGV